MIDPMALRMLAAVQAEIAPHLAIWFRLIDHREKPRSKRIHLSFR